MLCWDTKHLINHTENNAQRMHRLYEVSVFIMHVRCYNSRVSLTTTTGLLQTCLAGFLAVLDSIPGFLSQINRITVGHWRRDVICLAHHGRQSHCVQQNRNILLLQASICESGEEIYKNTISWLAGYMRRVQAYKNSLLRKDRAVHGACWSHVVHLLSSHWPLCLCVALPPTEREATESHMRQIPFCKFFFFFWHFFFFFWSYAMEDKIGNNVWVER